MPSQLDDRKQKILKAVIADYLETAEPVGSRRISKKFDLDISPATIRNEMADLEEAGYIVQPHTSAGRIPSDKGYRFYVDELMKEKKLSLRELSLIRKQLQKIGRDIDGLLHESLKILSNLSQYITVLTAPDIRYHHEKVYASGISNIVKLPEFKNLENLKHLLSMIEHEDILVHLLNEYAESDATIVKIGNENKLKEIKDCSIVVTTYHFSARSFGALGIIGPTRMSYDKVTGLLNSMAEELTHSLRGGDESDQG